MLDLFLLEIQCAENIGDYKTADILDKKLIKMAKEFNVEDKSIQDLENEFPGDDWIDPFDIEREPTDDELDFTFEFPDNESSLMDYLNDLKQDDIRLYEFANKMSQQGFDYDQIRKMVMGLSSVLDNPEENNEDYF